MPNQLPGQIDHMLRLIALKFQKTSQDLLRKIIVNSEVSVIEDTYYDNWNGGTSSHDVELLVPESLYLEALEEKNKLEEKISAAIGEVNKFENENIRKVIISIKATADSDWRLDHNDVRLTRLLKNVHQNSISRIWTEGQVRLFLSHKVECKVEMEALKVELSKYGISAFVAHTSIQPTKEWMDEIENALLTMDAIAVFLTTNYRESEWTDQEVGFAISKRVPIVPVSLTGQDPHGFIRKYQKMTACLMDIPKTAADIYSVLSEEAAFSDKLKDGMINSFIKSESFTDSIDFVEKKLLNMKSLSNDHIMKIKKGFSANTQLHTCVVVNRKLPLALYAITKRQFVVQDKKLLEVGE